MSTLFKGWLTYFFSFEKRPLNKNQYKKEVVCSEEVLNWGHAVMKDVTATARWRQFELKIDCHVPTILLNWILALGIPALFLKIPLHF